MRRLYLVRWEKKIEAESPRQAAELAREMLDPDGFMSSHELPTIFNVYWGTSHSERVDLKKPEKK